MLTSNTPLEASDCNLHGETCPVSPAGLPVPSLFYWGSKSILLFVRTRPHCVGMYLSFHSFFTLLCFVSLKLTLDYFRFQVREVIVISVNWVLKIQILLNDGMGNLLDSSVLSFLSPYLFLSSLQKVRAYLHLCTYPLPVMMGLCFLDSVLVLLILYFCIC